MPLGVSSTTIWNMVGEGEVKTFKIGDRTLIKRAELEDVFEQAGGQWPPKLLHGEAPNT